MLSTTAESECTYGWKQRRVGGNSSIQLTWKVNVVSRSKMLEEANLHV